MAIISRLVTWSDNQVLSASALNGEINNIMNDYNGNITDANLSASASISTSKINATFPSGAIVGTTDSQSLDNKQLNSPVILTPTITTASINKIQGATSATKFPVIVGEYNNGNSSTNIAINWNNGDRQLVTITGDACTINFSNPTVGQTLTLRVVVDGSGHTAWSFPSSPKWPGGSAGTPTTTASAINLYAFYYDGTNYLANLSAGFA